MKIPAFPPYIAAMMLGGQARALVRPGAARRAWPALLVCAAACFIPTSIPAQTEPAGDAEQDLPAIRAKAEAGDPYWQAAMSAILRRGECGVKIDNAEALKWARKSAAQGHPMGKYELASCNLYGIGMDRDEEEAGRLFRRCFEGVRQLAEVGRCRAQYAVGYLYTAGQGVDADATLAARWTRKAAEQGNARAQWRMAGMFLEGEGVEQSAAMAVEWFRKAAEQGSAEAQFSLGRILAEGRGVPQDGVEAAKWFERAAEQGWQNALLRLGDLYCEGNGVAKDLHKAIEIYEKGMAEGIYGSLGKCAYAYSQKGDYAEAVRCYRLGAQRGESGCMNNMGVLYLSGQGVERDPKRALAWYDLATQHGCETGPRNAGEMFLYGNGVPRDDEAAARYFRIAAGRGNGRTQGHLQEGARAGKAPYQFQLADLYYCGTSELHDRDLKEIEPDLKESLYWYAKAAGNGHSGARRMLELLKAWELVSEQDLTDARRRVTEETPGLASSAEGRGDGQTTTNGSRFAFLRDLGLPDVRGAVYAALETDGWRRHEMWFADYREAQQVRNKAWLLSEDKKAGKAVLLMDGCRVVEMLDRKAFARRMEKSSEAAPDPDSGGEDRLPDEFRGRPGGGALSGTWRKADPQEGLSAIIAFLRKEPSDRDRADWAMQSGLGGVLLMEAAHFDRQGYAAQAARIADLLFEKVEDRRTVVFQAMDRMADAGYEKACDEFRGTGDWQAFNASLQQLLDRFAAGWQRRPAVERLARRVAKRAEGRAPRISGDGITAADAELAAELAEAQAGDPTRVRRVPVGAWVLRAESGADGEDAAAPHLFDRIVRRGMAAVPMLMALLEDEWLTNTEAWWWSGESWTAGYDGRNEPPTMTAIDAAYRGLRRPATRAEIAESLLRPLLLPERDSADPFGMRREAVETSSLQDTCRRWREETRGMSGKDLARWYLVKGSPAQQCDALTYLARYGDASELDGFEDRVLQSDEPWIYAEAVRAYLAKRSERAEAFLKACETRVREVMKRMMADAEGLPEDYVDELTEQYMRALKDSGSR